MRQTDTQARTEAGNSRPFAAATLPWSGRRPRCAARHPLCILHDERQPHDDRPESRARVTGNKACLRSILRNRRAVGGVVVSQQLLISEEPTDTSL